MSTFHTHELAFTFTTRQTNSKHFPCTSAQVKRRFSDFEWLHQRLQTRFRGAQCERTDSVPSQMTYILMFHSTDLNITSIGSAGTIIPPIPEKRWTGNMDATFVEERRQALEHFIVRTGS